MEKRPLTSTGSVQVAVREKNKDKLIFSFLRIKSPRYKEFLRRT